MTAFLYSCGNYCELAPSEVNFELPFLFLDSGAVLDTTPSEELSALDYAAMVGNIKLIDHLLAKGIDINWTAVSGGSPFSCAVLASNMTSVRHLMHRGAQPLIKYGRLFLKEDELDVDEDSVIVSKKMLQLLAELGLALPIYNFSKLMTGLTNVMAELDLKFYREVDICDLWHEATLTGTDPGFDRAELLQVLLANGVKLPTLFTNEFRSHRYENDLTMIQYDQPPLFYACFQENYDLFLLFLNLALGQVSDRHPKTGDTFLHVMSCSVGKGEDLVDYLLEQSVNGSIDVNALNLSGNTPLLSAISALRTLPVMKLLQHGADPNAVANNQKPALFLAIERCRVDFVQAHLEAGANANFVISKGVNEGSTPLHCCFTCRKIVSTQFVKVCHDLLFQYGADPRIRNSAGHTCYDLVILKGQGQVDVMKRRYGLDVHALNQSLFVGGKDA